MEETVMAILCDICGAAPGELEPRLDMFEAGLLDSFGVVQLLAAVEEKLGLAPDIETLTRPDIATPERVIALLRAML
jgi:D-alanine--poly(phosphoribitol) ligase subunit 2